MRVRCVELYALPESLFRRGLTRSRSLSTLQVVTCHHNTRKKRRQLLFINDTGTSGRAATCLSDWFFCRADSPHPRWMTAGQILSPAAPPTRTEQLIIPFSNLGGSSNSCWFWKVLRIKCQLSQEKMKSRSPVCYKKKQRSRHTNSTDVKTI